jgi:hypothetical protein
VNLELVKATASCRLSGPSGSQPQRRPVPLGQDRGLEATFNPVAQVQFEEGAFPKFSQSLLLITVFEDEDEDDDEDEYETPNTKRLVRMQGGEPGSARLGLRGRDW